LAAQELLDGEAEAITRKAIELALQGNTTALKLCMDRFSPVPRERPLHLDELPPLESIYNLGDVVAAILKAAVAGGLGIGDAIKLVEIYSDTGSCHQRHDSASMGPQQRPHART
jgi:hypothetical protein